MVMSKTPAIRRPLPLLAGLTSAVVVSGLLTDMVWQRVRAEGFASSASTPVITWRVPASIDYGTPLSGLQLNASTTVPGSFIYAPPVGTILSAGAGQTLAVAFSPVDATNYRTANATVRIDVLKVTPRITWPPPDTVVDGTILGPAQLNATASTAGIFSYTPPRGTVLHAGAIALSATFTPAALANYVSTTSGVRLTVVPTLSVSSTSPGGGETVFATSPFTISWTASGGIGGGPLSFDVSYSTDGGAHFTPVSECTGISGTLRSCIWRSPVPSTTRGRIRVVGRDVAGNQTKSVTAADFTVTAHAPFVAVTNPSAGASWAIGTIRQITWSGNLGLSAPMRIDQSLDGGSTWAVVAARVKSATSTTGIFDWKVPNTPAAAARLRVTWLNGRASSVSNSFAIQSPTIVVDLASRNWSIGKPGAIRWAHNLPVGTVMTIEVSRDGGQAWAVIARLRAKGTQENYSWAPTGPATTMATIRVTAPDYGTVGTSRIFGFR
jgi:hypothetical protein